MSLDGGKGIGSSSWHTELEAITCPRCGAYTALDWYIHGPISRSRRTIAWAECAACLEPFLRLGEQLVYPTGLVGPVPAEDMSDPVREVYEEARAIAVVSPRAAAALLRVCVEMVVNELVPGTDKLNTKIATLVERNLDPGVQKMLDTVRVYGNDGGAHPGEIDLKDQPEVVPMLMFCVNRIVEQMVTWPRQVDALYESLPESKREGIENRDRKKAKRSPSRP